MFHVKRFFVEIQSKLCYNDKAQIKYRKEILWEEL